MNIRHMRTAAGVSITLIAVFAAVGCGDTSRLAGPISQSGETRRSESTQSAAPNVTDDSRILESSFDDVKFEMRAGEPFKRALLTPEIEELFGRRIRIRGYMLPSFKESGIKQFVLVRDNLECCFGPGAALFDCVLVTMQNGKTVEFSDRPVAVEGRFQFSEFLDPADDTHLAIYALEGESVK